MEIVHKVCCGIDVHKKHVTAAIAISNPITLEASYFVKNFKTFNSDLINLRDWILSYNCYEVCMESTGKYWIPVFNTLETHMHTILTHPKYVKAIKGKKTDNHDAKWIANLFRFDIVRSSFIPPAEIRALRELFRYRCKLSHQRTAEKNRYQNSMTISRVRMDSVLTDPFGKTATNIMQYLLNTKNFSEAKCRSLIDFNVKAEKHDILMDSINGFHILPEQKFKMQKAKAHIDFINDIMEDIEKQMFLLTRPYEKIISRASVIPGITPFSAACIIAEIGTDMTVFESDKNLASWAGLVPANNESAGKKKSTRISKAGLYLKPLLIQCALSAIRSTKNPYFNIKYNRIKKRRGHKKAIIAIARMMLISIYHIIKNDEEFKPSDFEEIVNPKQRVKTPEFNIENVIQFLKGQGADEKAIEILIKQYSLP